VRLFGPAPSTPHRLFLLLTVLWVGSLWTIGYIVAPTLFATLPDRQLAGTIAGSLFRNEAIIGVIGGVLLLALSNMLVRRGDDTYRGLRWILLAMLLCILVGYFGLQPFMGALREKAAALGVAVAESPYKSQFGILHGVSSVFYLAQSLLGALLVWRVAGR
jgi:Na+-translocating ferredoxin:NAD+ oxidoreductase RnfA subunit